MGAGNTPDIQHGVVSKHGADADDNSVNACSEAMQMIERRASADPLAFACDRSYPPIKRLAELSNDIGAARIGLPDWDARVVIGCLGDVSIHRMKFPAQLSRARHL